MKARVLVWYHPEINLLMLRWKCGPAIIAYEGIAAINADAEKLLFKMLKRPSRYGWVKIGVF